MRNRIHAKSGARAGQVSPPAPFQLLSRPFTAQPNPARPPRAEKLARPAQNLTGSESQAARSTTVHDGRRLHASLLARAERLSGQDLSAVRVDESPAVSSFGAEALTVGNRILFAPGKYRPETGPGRELIGHELTHVLQQRGGKVAATRRAAGSPVNDQDHLEDEADRVGASLAGFETPSRPHALAPAAIPRAHARSRPPSPMLQLDDKARRKRKAKKKAQAKREEARIERGKAYQDRLQEKINQNGAPLKTLSPLKLQSLIRSIPVSPNPFAPLAETPPSELDSLPDISPELHGLYQRGAKRDETSYRISGRGKELSVEGQQGAYDEDFGEGAVFWRGDTRPPKQVLKTGFTPKVERDFGRDAPGGGKRPNTIVYRTGDDDIVPASGVCVARDVRGGCFFPFKSEHQTPEANEEHSYMYALRVKQATNTFAAQQDAEFAETGSRRKDPQRYPYDPSERNAEESSAIWPYHEHVVHRVNPEQVLGAWRVRRERLIPGSEDDIKAGMRFQIHPKNLARRKPGDEHQRRLLQEAQQSVESYQQPYPRQPDQYLSYQGTVRKKGKQSIKSTDEAQQMAEQVRALPPGRGRYDARKQKRREELARKREASRPGKQRRARGGRPGGR